MAIVEFLHFYICNQSKLSLRVYTAGTLVIIRHRKRGRFCLLVPVYFRQHNIRW